MHKYLSTTHRSVVWFKKAFESGDLIIKAPFQRNPVWSDRQKSALIDTILLEYPIPELYMQDLTDAQGNQKYILVDGQQRIRAVLDFLNSKLELEDESPHWAGCRFDDLAEADKKKLFEYSFVVRQLPDIPEEELRIIFQRLNRNTMTLTPQELRHATYWGPFIKLMEEVADIEYWNDAGVFSANDRRRMTDVEFASEIAIAHLNGIQNKKKNLEEYYQQYEEAFEEAGALRATFTKVLGEIEQVLPSISKSRWRKKSDFYSLFLVLAAKESKLPLSADRRVEATRLLTEFADKVDSVIRETWPQGTPVPANIGDYVKNVERAASDLATRTERARVLAELLAPVFQ
ncbi:MAG: DUF262 domain-containing protein [Kiritimatiellae bacterium]|nr:DUF262 domain-containing protein [Kiritimatiellia bacterium]